MAITFMEGDIREGIYVPGSYSVEYTATRTGNAVEYVFTFLIWVDNAYAPGYGQADIICEVDGDRKTTSIGAHQGNARKTLSFTVIGGSVHDSTKPAYCKITGAGDKVRGEKTGTVIFPAGGITDIPVYVNPAGMVYQAEKAYANVPGVGVKEVAVYANVGGEIKEFI